MPQALARTNRIGIRVLSTVVTIALMLAGAAAMFATTAAPHLAAFSSAAPTVVHRVQDGEAAPNGTSSLQAVCMGHLHVERWHPYFGPAVRTLDEGLRCFDRVDASSRACLQHVDTIFTEHFPTGATFIDRLAANFEEVVDLTSDLEGHAGVCEVPGEGFLPFLRLRSAQHTHAMGSRLQRHRHMRRRESGRDKAPKTVKNLRPGATDEGSDL
jgi:hypothetical protein